MADFGSELMLTNMRVFPTPPRHGCNNDAIDPSSVFAPTVDCGEPSARMCQQTAYLQQMCQLRVSIRHM